MSIRWTVYLLLAVGAPLAHAADRQIKVFGRAPIDATDVEFRPTKLTLLTHGLYVTNGRDGHARIRQMGAPDRAATIQDTAFSPVKDYAFTLGGKTIEQAAGSRVESVNLPAVSALLLVGRNVVRTGWWFDPRFGGVPSAFAPKIVATFPEDVDGIVLRQSKTRLFLRGTRDGKLVKRRFALEPAPFDSGATFQQSWVERPMDVDHVAPDPGVDD